MDELLTFLLRWLNSEIALALVLAALFLLRALMVRLFSHQQRAVLWTGVLLSGMICFGRRRAVYPVTFLDLVTPRVSMISGVEYLPGEYRGEGLYHLALPGGTLVPFSLSAWVLWLVLALWLAGMGVMVALCVRQSRALSRAAARGQRLERGDPRLALLGGEAEYTEVVLCSGLPSSFVRREFLELQRHQIMLQQELTESQLELVLRHEGKHIRLFHVGWKWLATVVLILHWWNPAVWLAFRLLCRDLELACDSAVLKELDRKGRRDYARLLVELGAGRPLWMAPASFGECDGALRVKAAAVWKKRPWWINLLTWAAALALILFFLGVHWKEPPPQDMPLAWEREKGAAELLLADVGREMRAGLPGQGTQNIQDGDVISLTALWEAPEPTPRSAFWALGEDGSWYYIRYTWWGETADWVGVIDWQEVPPPDLTGCRRVI